MTQETQLLTDNNGNVVTAFHGTYYDFDYFFPLTHFGTEYAAKRVLNEGKWKRDKNIDINIPILKIGMFVILANAVDYR